MNPNGRPKTRSLESQMVAIYRVVSHAMINNESKNVSEACRAIFDKNSLIKFTDPALPEYKKITDVCLNAENLRKRYYRAIECSRDAEKYPILASIVTQFGNTLDYEINRHKQWREAYANIRQSGHHPSGEY